MEYKNTTFRKILNGIIQGGDVNQDGGESIYGKYFEDESYLIPHDRPGIVGELLLIIIFYCKINL